MRRTSGGRENIGGWPVNLFLLFRLEKANLYVSASGNHNHFLWSTKGVHIRTPFHSKDPIWYAMEDPDKSR